MDCIDCHNRPTHIYHPPSKSVNHYISIERINKSLPSIKTIAVTALENEYFTSKGALDSIKHYIENYYLENYPKLLKEKNLKLMKRLFKYKIFTREIIFQRCELIGSFIQIILGIFIQMVASDATMENM